VLAGDSALPVLVTQYVDFRVGGHVAVFIDEDTFDVAKVASVAAGIVTIDGELVNGYAAGAVVCPLRFVRIVGSVVGTRKPVGVEFVRVTYQSVENDVGALNGDLTPFELLGGMPIYDRETFCSQAIRKRRSSRTSSRSKVRAGSRTPRAIRTGSAAVHRSGYSLRAGASCGRFGSSLQAFAGASSRSGSRRGRKTSR
jgi:hypothetical protein